MKITGIIKRAKAAQVAVNKFGFLMDHLHHKGFFGPYLESLEKAPIEKIDAMLLELAGLDFDPGREMAAALKGAIIGFVNGRNGKRVPR